MRDLIVGDILIIEDKSLKRVYRAEINEILNGVIKVTSLTENSDWEAGREFSLRKDIFFESRLKIKIDKRREDLREKDLLDLQHLAVDLGDKTWFYELCGEINKLKNSREKA